MNLFEEQEQRKAARADLIHRALQTRESSVNLTEDQLQAISVCVVCQEPMDLEYPRQLLERGETPGAFYCPACRDDPKRVIERLYTLGKRASVELVVARLVEAGLKDQFKHMIVERDMRDNNEHN